MENQSVHSEYTINDFLKSPHFRGLELVAGHIHSDNVITNVNVVDNPDSYDWFSPGDLILTTGYVFKDDSKAQEALIQHLAKIGCAGLLIKIKRYWQQVPAKILEEANLQGLPVLTLPLDYNLAQVSNHINNELGIREESMVKQVLKVHQTLLDCSLNGGTAQDLAKMLSHLVKNPLLVADNDWQIYALAHHQVHQPKLARFLDQEPGDIRLPRDYTQQLPTSFYRYRKSIKREMVLEGELIPTVLIPIRAAENTYGYLITFPVNVALEAFDYMALEQAVAIFALDMLRTQEFDHYRVRLKNEFFADALLKGNMNDQSHILGPIIREDLRVHFVTLVIHFKHLTSRDMLWGSAAKDEAFELHHLISRKVRDYIDESEHKIVDFFYGSNLVFYFAVNQTQNPVHENRLEELQEFIGDIQEIMLKDLDESSYVIAVGRSLRSVKDVLRGYKEAVRAIHLADTLGVDGQVIYYRDLMRFDLFINALRREDLQDFKRSYLEPLRSYDLTHGTDLTSTLKVYLESNAQVNLAAQNLYMHRNTMMKRLKDIEEILGRDLNDFETLFDIRLSYYIDQIEENM